MVDTRVPPDESARVAALHRYEVLDTLPDEDYDAIVRLAAHICGTPIALIDFVDTDRGWFKARVGLDADEVPRADAMCSTAILQPDVALVVEDLAGDERFADNPLVVDDPALRFYAGSPLVSPDGHAVGTICVMDTEPRRLAPEQVGLLRDLGRQVVAQLELRRANRTKAEFLSRMSHELRTPLNAILGFGQLVESDPALAPELRADVQSIVAAGRRLLELVDEVLDRSHQQVP